jgi:hypothetical protein
MSKVNKPYSRNAYSILSFVIEKNLIKGISTLSYWLKRKSAITGNMDISNIMHIHYCYDNIAG